MRRCRRCESTGNAGKRENSTNLNVPRSKGQSLKIALTFAFEVYRIQLKFMIKSSEKKSVFE